MVWLLTHFQLFFKTSISFLESQNDRLTMFINCTRLRNLIHCILLHFRAPLVALAVKSVNDGNDDEVNAENDDAPGSLK